MSRRRDRPRRPARGAVPRDPKPVILIVTEGEVTEPQYLDGFAKACRNPRVHIEIVGEGGVPKSVVELAKRRKQEAVLRARRERNDNLAYDEVWAVFDVDEHPRVAEARVMARDNDILLAVSNPCIELWLLLHFRDSPGIRHRDDLPTLLREFVPDYNKHVQFAQYRDGYPAAMARAQKLDKTAEAAGEPGRNPTTGLYRLIRSIERS